MVNRNILDRVRKPLILHIIFKDHTLVRDYVTVQYSRLSSGSKLSEFAQKVLEDVLPDYALDHVWFLLRDAHESTGNDEIKGMLNPETFGDKFGYALYDNTHYKLFDLDQVAK